MELRVQVDGNLEEGLAPALGVDVLVGLATQEQRLIGGAAALDGRDGMPFLNLHALYGELGFRRARIFTLR